MELVITKDLQNVVRNNSHISKIYWDKNGRHYFNVFKLSSDGQSEETQLYGTGVYSHNQVIPGKTNIDKLTEIISKGDPETLIVGSITRENLLKATPVSNEETTASKILNSTPEEKAAILAALGLTPEIIAALNKKEEEPKKVVIPS